MRTEQFAFEIYWPLAEFFLRQMIAGQIKKYYITKTLVWPEVNLRFAESTFLVKS